MPRRPVVGPLLAIGPVRTELTTRAVLGYLSRLGYLIGLRPDAPKRNALLVVIYLLVCLSLWGLLTTVR
ncbi:hypothetical protein [Haloarchaeobius sp. DFWS5]|uniref:hypothetical protein n=1 Tax=Haloarchaeobius sp. DFWS5 TaxID=3446114 RepID=UPI003EBBA1B1